MSFLFFVPDGPPAYCCTCAGQLQTTLSEKPYHRQLPCCQRFICGSCMEANPRFATYCPYCQVATAPPPSSKTGRDVLPPTRQALARSTASQPPPYEEAPPPYEAAPAGQTAADEKQPRQPASTPDPEKEPAPIIHFLDHDRDSVTSLALRYRVPADAIRRANRLGADHLLVGRRVVHIPAASRSDGPGASASSSSSSAVTQSLSPRPVEGEAEARRKATIRRFMVACKVADYDLAVLYLDQTAVRVGGGESASSGEQDTWYDLAAAVEAYQADEQWERAHPLAAAAKQKGKGKQKTPSRLGGGFFSRQRSER